MTGRIWTVPNQITLLRLGFLPLFLILIVYEHYRWALLILVLAGLSDGIDGLLARKLDQKSSIGAYLDPIADKLLLSSSFVILAMEKKIPWWLTIMVLSRDILMLMGLLFAASLVLLLRFIRPEQLLKVESLPDLTAFFATLQSPITPLLPSFWAGETLFASLRGGSDLLHAGALWTTALASTVVLGAANERWYFAGFSKSQEASKTRFTRLRGLDDAVGALPLSVVRRQLLIKDLKIFLRDVGQWSQLLLLLALVLVYLYNFRVLDLERIPYMSGFVKNIYAFVNLGMAGFVMATVAVRFVFPAVSAEGAAFWIIRTSPISLRDFLWSKFWTGLVPVLVLTEGLTVVGNQFLGVDPFLKVMSALAIVFMSFALVGLAIGLGARYPRFDADASQVAGSYGGVAFMMQAVLFIIVMLLLLGWPSSLYLFRQVRRVPLTVVQRSLMLLCFVTAAALSLAIWVKSMRDGVRALQRMGE